MKAAIVLCFLTGICFAADPKPAPAAPEKAAVKPVEIPAGAVEIAAGSYRFTDAAGVTWLLRRSPFGVMAVEEKSVAAAVRATEDGDSVRFVESTPFGPYNWERKKSELNLSERAIWEQQRAPNNAK